MVLDSPTGSAIVVPAHGLSDSPFASACAASRDSTSARRSRSCAQASSRKALRSPGSRPSAAPTISLILCQFADTISLFVNDDRVHPLTSLSGFVLRRSSWPPRQTPQTGGHCARTSSRCRCAFVQHPNIRVGRPGGGGRKLARDVPLGRHRKPGHTRQLRVLLVRACAQRRRGVPRIIFVLLQAFPVWKVLSLDLPSGPM